MRVLLDGQALQSRSAGDHARSQVQAVAWRRPDWDWSFVEADHPEAGRFRQTGPVLAGQGPPDRPYALRASTDTDVEQVLAAAGLQPEEIAELLDAGVVA